MTDSLPLATAASRRTVRQDRTLWAVQIFLAVFFLVAAVGPKLLGQQYAVDMFDQIGAGQWLRYAIGSLELAGAVGLLVPRLVRPAALGFVALMAGAVITQVSVLEAPVMALTPAVLLALAACVAWARRPQTS
ncbi:MAG: DoxX family protein [Pseudonocardiales bacterium]